MLRISNPSPTGITVAVAVNRARQCAQRGYAASGTAKNADWDTDDVLHSDKSREENARKPNVAKDLRSLQDKYAPSHTGGNQPDGSGQYPTNTAGYPLPRQDVNHTGNHPGQADVGPSNTGGNQTVDSLPNNTGDTVSVPELPNHLISDGHDNGAEKPSNIKVAEDNLLKNNGIDAHQIKKDFLGAKAEIKLYDIYVDKDNGQLWIFRKGGKGEGIPTDEFINK